MTKRFTLLSGLTMCVVATMSAVQSSTPFITEPGEGELTTWSRSSVNVINLMGMDFSGPDYGGAVNMVTASDGTVWIDYFLGGFRTNGWTVGKINGDKLTIALPQEIYNEEGVPYYLTVVDRIDDDTFIAGSESEIVFTKDGDSWKCPLQTYSKFLGLVSASGSFSGAGDYRLNFTPFDIPEDGDDSGIDFTSYSFISGETGHIVELGEKDNTMYVKGLLESYPDTFITGEINGDKVSFKSGQYLGIRDEEGNTPHYNFMMAVTEEANEVFKAENSLDFTWNKTNGSLESTGSFVYNHTSNPEIINFTKLCENPRFVERKDGEHLVPSNPANVTLNKGKYETSVVANISQLSTTGVLLDPEQLYYRVYIDGELFTFYNDEYKYLDMEEMTDVPYNYSESYDFMVNGTYHEIYFYVEDIDVVGIQSVYFGDGYTTVSDIVNSDGTTISGVKTVANDVSPVLSTEYFDLLGRKVNHNTKGIVIKRETKADGTTQSTKIIL